MAEKSALAARHNMLYMNTVVTRGRLEALATATGMTTEMLLLRCFRRKS